MDRVNILPNERMDVADMRALAGQLALDELIRRTAGFLLPAGRDDNVPQTDCRVIEGFDVVGSPIGGTSFEVTQGKAICKLLDDGELKHGAVLSDQDPATFTVDMSGLSDATYNIWARCVAGDDDQENRIFWNPTGSPAAEYVDSVATRQNVTWELIAVDSTASPPGDGEYFRLWQVVISSGTIFSYEDQRVYYFEGSAADSPAWFPEWGDGTNDRNADRGTYGVKDLHKFVHLVLRQLSEIIDKGASPSKHYADPDIGLAALALEHKTNGDHADVDCDTMDCAGQATAESLIVNSAGTAGLKSIQATADNVNAVDAESASADAVRGESTSGAGIYGQSTDAEGVSGYSTNDAGVKGVSALGVGVKGSSFSLTAANSVRLPVMLASGQPEWDTSGGQPSWVFQSSFDWKLIGPANYSMFWEVPIPHMATVGGVYAFVQPAVAGQLRMMAFRVSVDYTSGIPSTQQMAAAWASDASNQIALACNQNNTDFLAAPTSGTTVEFMRIAIYATNAGSHIINSLQFTISSKSASYLEGITAL